MRAPARHHGSAPRPRWRPAPATLRRAVGCLLLAALGAVAAGCATVVTPPAQVREPTAVLLLDHGRHASLVVPDGLRLIRYAYGDWAWYAEMHTGFGDALRALFRASRAALGRRTLHPPPEPAVVRAQLKVGVVRIHVLRVEQARAAALARRLEAVYQANSATRHYNAAYDLHFVSHPTPYRWSHNSNHVVAAWLRELGCEVRGPLALADWQVAPGAGRP